MTLMLEEVRPEGTAVVVIDMQNDYVHREGGVLRYFREKHGSTAGAHGPTTGELMVPWLIKLVEMAREAAVKVIWVKTLQTPWTETPYWRLAWDPPPSKDPGWGTALYDGLVPQGDEPVVIKRRHSCFFRTEMDSILSRLQIRTLLMTGVGTPYCVESSVRDAFARDYRVITISDATATRERHEHEEALHRIATAFGSVASTAEIILAWHGDPSELSSLDSKGVQP